jgi:hypothetical protein
LSRQGRKEEETVEEEEKEKEEVYTSVAACSSDISDGCRPVS